MTKVYGDFDQETLDNEYLISKTVPDIGPFISDYGRLSEEARATLVCREDVAYGDHADEVIDVFPAGEGAPIFFFIHGGYWRMLSHKDSSFMAPACVAKGVAVVAVNYSLTGSGATIDIIVDQCRRALAWTHKNAESFGGDPSRIFVCGSSAGGHLTGMMVAGGWHDDYGVPADIVRGAVPLSGIHDLEPLQLSCINDWAALDVDGALRNSPVRHLPDTGCPLIVSYGHSETSEFKRQSNLLADAWTARGWQADCFEHPTRNHFDIVFDLCDPKSLLGAKVFGMMGA
jgi:arylformamidase